MEIRLMLTRRRMSQSDLARKLGVSTTWVSYRLNGKQPIDLNDLAAIARVLAVKPSQLLVTLR
jgi:transcriptional regulator with XRE-family HTH domain